MCWGVLGAKEDIGTCWGVLGAKGDMGMDWGVLRIQKEDIGMFGDVFGAKGVIGMCWGVPRAKEGIEVCWGVLRAWEGTGVGLWHPPSHKGTGWAQGRVGACSHPGTGAGVSVTVPMSPQCPPSGGWCWSA